MKKALFLALEKARTHRNFTTNTVYSYIDKYLNKNGFTSVYIIKAVHDFIMEYMLEENGLNDTKTLKINGELVEIEE